MLLSQTKLRVKGEVHIKDGEGVTALELDSSGAIFLHDSSLHVKDSTGADRFVVVVDGSKVLPGLGGTGGTLPVEVVTHGEPA